MARPQALLSHRQVCVAGQKVVLNGAYGRRIHIGIDEQTLEIRADEVTSSSIGCFHGLQTNHCRSMDAPILPDLLNQISSDQETSSVTGDGAYDTRKCHDAISARNANAVISLGLRPSRAELIH